jgi:hypothetical protein
MVSLRLARDPEDTPSTRNHFQEQDMPREYAELVSHGCRRRRFSIEAQRLSCFQPRGAERPGYAHRICTLLTPEDWTPDDRHYWRRNVEDRPMLLVP